MKEIDNTKLKGDASCHCPSDEYRDNYDKIFKKKEEKDDGARSEDRSSSVPPRQE